MFRSTAYRHSSEYTILFVTLLLTLGVVLLTAMLTQCLSMLLILLMFAFTIWSTNAMQKTLMAKAFLVHPQTDPRLASIVETCHKRLKPGPLRVYIVRQQMVNAYTFGLSDPKSVVVCEPMLRVMSPGELSFVIGHEMGRALGKPAIFVERPTGTFELCRGFAIAPGAKVLLVEDVVTTGLSSREAMAAVAASGGEVIGAASLVDRSGGTADLGVPFTPLIALNFPTYAPDEVPPQLAATPAIKPGSRAAA